MVGGPAPGVVETLKRAREEKGFVSRPNRKRGSGSCRRPLVVNEPDYAAYCQGHGSRAGLAVVSFTVYVKVSAPWNPTGGL